MPEQLQASSPPVGEPPSTMLPDLTRTPDKGRDTPDSSQTESVDPLAETTCRRRCQVNRRPNSNDPANSYPEILDAMDSLSNESNGAAEGIPARSKPRSPTEKATRISKSVTPCTPQRSNATKRGHYDHQSETTRPLKRGRPTTANTQVKKFEKDALGWVESFASIACELEVTRSDNQELKKKVNFLRSELEQEKADHTQAKSALNQRIMELEDDCKRWRTELVSAIDRAKKDSGKYLKVSDSDIEQRWNTLSYNIRGIVSRCLTGQPTEQNDTLESLKNELQISLPRFDYKLTALRSYILRRTIWQFLMNGIFQADYPIWHGESGRTLTKFLAVYNLHHIQDTQHLKVISQMKYSAIAELGAEIQLAEKAMSELVSTVTRVLKDFIPDFTVNVTPNQGKYLNTDPTKGFQIQFKALITEAANLHTILMKSKAIFLVQWIGDGDGKILPLYKPEHMASCLYDIEEGASRPVNFVEAPALVKIGNADGENFHRRMTLCKSRVVLEEQKTDEPLEDKTSFLNFEAGSENGSEDKK